MGTGSVSRGYSCQGMALITHPSIGLKLFIGRAIQLPLLASNDVLLGDCSIEVQFDVVCARHWFVLITDCVFHTFDWRFNHLT
jgi:hypothetical protein